ncbi:MAG: NAD-dependent epimerase/dehydratase [Crocinitomicaceae bacterium]|jgi:nucleoside-diphosphate-sugar epimerase|nr:NAD-dependent epimerase/dehydratase [Crocinitomicaceae bacterium]
MGELAHKKIVITGGTGFIGSRLAERLVLEEHADVTVLVNSWAKATWVSRLNVSLVQGKITDQKLVNRLTKDADLVFHCVGIGGTLEEARAVNVGGTQAVLEACRENKVKRLIYLSSVVVSGALIPDGMNEEAPYKLTGNPYADTKIEAEQLLLDFTRENNMETAVIRPTFVWGPCSPYYTIDVVQQMKNDTFLLVDEGHGSCNAVHVDHVVDCCILAAHKKEAAGEVFLVTDKAKMSWKHFWGYYAQMLGKNTEAFASVSSVDSPGKKRALQRKLHLEKRRRELTEKINLRAEKSPVYTKYFLKAPRKLIKMAIARIEKRYPVMDPWDVEAYASTGVIDISKAERLLGFKPRFTVEEAMKSCEIWLKDQNYLS